jgi:hypothetical protein
MRDRLDWEHCFRQGDREPGRLATRGRAAGLERPRPGLYMKNETTDLTEVLIP